MGVEPERMPPTESGREELYRRLTLGRRALVVVDHVSSVAQVRGLLPAAPDVFLVVVVSGPPLTPEAERVAVPPPRERDAVKMLKNVAGRENVARNKVQVPHVLDHCAGNAFALKAAALRLLTEEPGLPEAQGAPAAETPGHHPVRGTARDASRRVRPATARLRRLTALADWPAVDAWLAGAAAGVEPDEAAGMLAEAAAVQLLEPLPDDRYRFRPEVRRYLADTAGPEHGIAECSTAVARVLDSPLNRALHAAHAALPQSWRTEPAPAEGTPYDDEARGLEPLRVPGGVEHHEPLSPAHSPRTPEPLPVRKRGQHAVETRIVGEYRGVLGLGADAAQPLHLLRVGEHETFHERLPVRQRPLRRQAERRLPARPASWYIRRHVTVSTTCPEYYEVVHRSWPRSRGPPVSPRDRLPPLMASCRPPGVPVPPVGGHRRERHRIVRNTLRAVACRGCWSLLGSPGSSTGSVAWKASRPVAAGTPAGTAEVRRAAQNDRPASNVHNIRARYRT